jgi:DUF971 family protein
VFQRVDPVGHLIIINHYALRPSFSDGHNSGIFAWDYLYELGVRQQELWQQYLARLAEAGASRDKAA